MKPSSEFRGEPKPKFGAGGGNQTSNGRNRLSVLGEGEGSTIRGHRPKIIRMILMIFLSFQSIRVHVPLVFPPTPNAIGTEIGGRANFREESETESGNRNLGPNPNFNVPKLAFGFGDEGTLWGTVA
jgi:hypothetical protein